MKSRTATLIAFFLSFVAQLWLNTAAEAQTNLAHNGRFSRGTGVDPSFHSFIVPLSYQKGMAYDASGGNATNWYPNINWTNFLYHFDATNPAPQTNLTGRIPFKNPIAAFGSRVGGTPLCLGQTYDFGAYAGNPYLDASDGSFFSWDEDDIYVNVYDRATRALVNYFLVQPPHPYTTNDWIRYLTNGYTFTVESNGLRTVVSLSPYARWGSRFLGTYILSHTATSAATNYFYMIEALGFAGLCCSPGMVMISTNFRYYSPLYTLEFEPRTANRSRFVDQPHFDGSPLPPAYQGKTVDELLAVQAAMPTLSGVSWTNFTALTNQSPELRSHSILDQFVTDMGGNALALANYVLNEIELADFMDYDTNQNQQAAVHLGGINRSALATFQEGRGSPLEQCALLVYLLRKAGVPAAFIYPTNNGLTMLDIQLSKLFGFQVRKAQLDTGLSFMPSQIPVNYPWVVAYLTNEARWVHLVPWLKDQEVIEGLDLYKLMSTNYNKGYKWLVRYLEQDTNIVSLSTVSDQTAVLFPKFIEKQLSTNAPGISLDDIGTTVTLRKRLFARWDDFPKPFSLTGAVQVVESHKDSTNLFNTIQVRVYCLNATNKFVDSGELRIADLHNRPLTLRTEQVGTNNTHNLILRLSKHDLTTTNFGTFGAGANPYFELTNSVQVHSTNDQIQFRTTHKRLRHLPTNYVVADRSTNFWQYAYVETEAQKTGLTFTNESTFRKGDLAAFCFDVGRVAPKMLRVHAQNLWQLEQQIATNSSSQVLTDRYLETSTYLMGMSYWEFYDRFNQQNLKLHKLREIANYSHGFGLLRPQRTNDALPNNGQVKLVEAGLDIPVHGSAVVFNGTLRPDTAHDLLDAYWDYFMIKAAHGSGAEHGTVQSFYRTNAVSTVRLLHLTGATNILRLHRQNYEQYRTNIYAGKTLQEHDPGMWSAVEAHFNNNDTDDFYKQVFMTPGAVTAGSYKGVGAMMLAPYGYGALISGLLNGASGYQFPATTFTSDNSSNFGARVNAPGATTLYGVDLGFNEDTLVFNSVATPDLSSTHAAIQNNQVVVDPTRSEGAVITTRLFGPGGTVADGVNLGGDEGCPSTQPSSFLDRLREFASDPVGVVNGDFYIDEVDLRLPGPMPLEVRRNYSSQNLAENQLGFAWNLNYMPFLSVSPSNNLIYAAEPDGTVIAYRQQNPPSGTLWAPAVADNPRLHNRTDMGIGSTANYFNGRIQKVVSGSTFYYLTNANGSLRVFEERSYSVGANFERRRPYLNKWFDERGNSYTFTYGEDSSKPDYGQVRRIESSNGSFLGFYYDVYGHILEIYAGDGRRLFYEYDAFGDLVKVTLPDASERIYEYQHSNFVTNSVTNLYSTHLIAREVKPDGRVLENLYDTQRRVTVQKATVGLDMRTYTNAVFTYANNFNLTNAATNFITGHTLVADAFNRVTRYDYTNSLITCITNPLSQAILQDWFEPFETSKPGYYPRSLESVIDLRGLETSYKYDTNGNVTSTTVRGDLTGTGSTSEQAVSTTSYNSNNLPAQSVDATGNTNRYFYTNTWLPSRVELQPANASGANIITNRLVYYNVTNSLNTNQVAYGLRRLEIRADGSPQAATNEWFHDYRGLETRRVRYAGTADPNITNYFVFNDRGELVEEADGAGRKRRLAYDGIGRQTVREVYEAGQTTPLFWEYAYFNHNGDLVWRDGAHYDPEDYIWNDYDGFGRHCEQIVWKSCGKADGSGVEAETGYDLFVTTFNEYNLFGDLVRSVNPRGVVTTNTFDAIGQLKTQRIIDTSGIALSTNGFAYGPGGDQTFHTNSLGGITETQYTYRGAPKLRKTPDGATNRWNYYLDGREQKQFLSNGSFWEASYDDANRKITRVFKNAGGTSLATNIVERDRRGNIVSTTDLERNVSTNLYDGLDRIRIAAGPVIPPLTNGPPAPGGAGATAVQQKLTYTYDASGQVLAVQNNVGEKIIRTSDALGRPVRVEVRNAGNATVRVTTTTYAANHHSQTVTNGSDANAIATTVYFDNADNPVLTVQYPTNGVIDYVFARYDAAGNQVELQERSKAGSEVTTWATNVWSYDGLNRVVSETIRNQQRTTFGYSALGNLTSRATINGLTWTATYTNDGRLITEKTMGGSLTARSITNEYYGAGHSHAGLLNIVRDGRGVSLTNTYDDFLRLAALTGSGPSPEHNLSTAYQYDRRGLIKEVSQSFATNSTGPSNTVRRAYNAYGQIASEVLLINGVHSERSIGNAWDNAGRRCTVGDFSQGFLYHSRADGLLTNVSYGVSGFKSYYWFTDGGILTNRFNSSREWKMDRRDGSGRILKDAVYSGAINVLTQTYAWRGDTRLTNYSAVRRAEFTDARTFAYAPFSRDLTQETFYVAFDQPVTMTYRIDFGFAARLGIITSASATGAATNKWGLPSTAGTDALGRVIQHTNTLARRQATGKARGAANVSGTLNGRSVRVEYDPVNTNGPWRADLDLHAGVNTLAMTANHPSGLFTTNATSVFTNTAGTITVTNSYDANGNLITRVHRNSSGQEVRTETFTWDAFNRLLGETLRDAFTNGYDYANVFDAFGRRLRNTHTTISSNVVQNTRTVQFWYDPDFEFMQLGFSVNGKRYWRVHGPDLNGEYAGLRGIGGLEAIVQEQSGMTTVLISDFFGNVVATNTYGMSAVPQFLPNRYTSYGPLEGYQPPALSANGPVAASFGWLGKPVEPTGKYDFHTRQYDPIERRFTSMDPAKWLGGNNPQWFCNNSPGHYYDPDGRLAQNIYENGIGARAFRSGADRFADINARAENPFVAGGAEYATYVWNMAADMMTPANHVNSLENRYNNTLEIYNRARSQGDSVLEAGYQGWGYNVGLNTGVTPLYEGLSQYDLPAARELDDIESWSRGLGGGGQLLLTATGGAGLPGQMAAETRLTSTVGDLRAAGLRDAHHVVQDAAVRDLPGYNTQLAPGVPLPGPSTSVGTPHYIATQVQRQAGGGTLAAEMRIGYRALRRAGYSEAQARQIIAESDAYFRSIGATPSTPTRIPGDR